ncbi:hypothetical protein BV898_17673 [Hypsibius exemplaris]|uniref:Uncharacterized protein n=1 Tax=Hypsibius exemplaris TaxID=2072580 RepID=A0A9X6RMA2_HYPEX|nr:hypothetical protein BV898_17673 [Hypsibius exemplaris]
MKASATSSSSGGAKRRMKHTWELLSKTKQSAPQPVKDFFRHHKKHISSSVHPSVRPSVRPSSLVRPSLVHRPSVPPPSSIVRPSLVRPSPVHRPSVRPPIRPSIRPSSVRPSSIVPRPSVHPSVRPFRSLVRPFPRPSVPRPSSLVRPSPVHRPSVCRPSVRLNMETVLQPTKTLLALFGLVILPKASTVFNTFCKLAGIVLLASGWVSCGLNIVVAGAAIIKPDPHWKVNAVVQALCLVPYGSVSFRGVVVVTVFFCRRQRWQAIWRHTLKLVRDNDIFLNGYDKVRSWHKLCLFLTLLTLILHVLWEYLNTVSYLELNNKTMSSDDVLDPLPLTSMRVGQYFLFWGCSSSLLFLLSQHVFICLIISARITQACCRNVNRLVREEILRLQSQGPPSRPSRNSSISTLSLDLSSGIWSESFKGASSLLTSVLEMKARFMDLLEHGQKLNSLFASLLLVMYLCDMLTAFGFTACLISNNAHGMIVTYVFEAVSVMLFMLYATLLLWPLVRAHEEGLKLNGLLHKLIGLVEDKYFSGRQNAYNHLHQVLHTFLLTSKDQSILFEGGGLLRITRMFVVTTVTLLMTFIFVAKEFLTAV